MQTGRARPVIPAVSPLSNVQFSRFTETEVAKILTFGSGGLLEVMVPMTDDERRDLETHLKQKFRLSLAIQVKARHVLVRRNRADLLEIRFDEKRERLVADPFFWYYFGFMDVTEMHFRAPVFLIPSDVVHASADPRPHGDLVRFTFDGSMDRQSKDRWRPYACDPSEVAGRVVKFLRAHEARRRVALPRAARSLIAQPGTILVARAA
jgi:hypothetical protein